MQVKHATAAMATASHASGKAAKSSSPDAPDFASLLSMLEAPATDASVGEDATALVDEGDASDRGPEREDEAAQDGLLDGREMPLTLAPMPAAAVACVERAVQSELPVADASIANAAPEIGEARLTADGPQDTGLDARGLAQEIRPVASRVGSLDMQTSASQTPPSTSAQTVAASAASRVPHVPAASASRPLETESHPAFGPRSTSGDPAVATSEVALETMMQGASEPTVQALSFHVEQLLGHAFPEAPYHRAPIEDGVLDGLALRGPETVGGGRPRFDIVARLSAELQGTLPSAARASHGGRSYASGKAARRETDSNAVADLAGVSGAAPGAHARIGHEVAGVVSNPHPVPLASLVPEVVRVASALADARKSGTQESSNVVEMRLDPPALGSLHVRVVEEQGVVHAFVTVANPAMEKVLAAEMAHLSTNLAHHGIVLGQVTVGSEASGGQGFGRPPEASIADGPAPVRRGGVAAPSSEPARAAPQAVPYGGRAVNLRA